MDRPATFALGAPVLPTITRLEETEMNGVTVRELERAELGDAARVLGRGMRDNPVNVQAFGGEADHRVRAMTRFFEAVLRGLDRRGTILGALRGGAIIGVCGMAPPGRCQPPLGEKLSVLPAIVLGNAVAVPLRVMRWVGEWSRRDPAHAHWHLGPVAVEPSLQGQGIGGAMVAEFCRRVDDSDAASYLETDKLENVRFYERFGYRVVAEAPVLGVANWFMMRTGRRE
jgi:GNAT superfamily N-acetyltransferase